MSQFESHIKKNLENIHKNLYLSKSDPQYYEKILRYKDPSSSDAHFRLAQEYEEKGALVKAYIHYQKAADSDSPHYFKAKRAYKSLEEKINPPQNPLPMTSRPSPSGRVPMYIKSIIAFLLFINLILVAFLFWKANPLSTIASSLKEWDTGMNVVYETEDVPYVLYFPEDTPNSEVEKTLYDEAIRAGNELSNKTLLLYGVRTSDSKLAQQLLPLKSEQTKDQAFVIAEYNSAIDQSVHIRFLNTNPTTVEDPYSYTYISTNLLRTALQHYIEDHGAAPSTLAALVDDYPNNYLSYIPNELYVGSNAITETFSGQGGWVYNTNASTVSEMVYPNVTETFSEDSVQIPYQPVEVVVDKSSFSLMVQSSPYIMSLKTVGLGKNNSTPEGTFTVKNRVTQPKGIHPNMFGVAGLGMGEYAIHGTYDEKSVGEEQSQGCIRLLNEDVQEVFNLVPKGATVTIVNNPLSVVGYTVLKQVGVITPKSKHVIDQNTNQKFQWAG